MPKVCGRILFNHEDKKSCTIVDRASVLVECDSKSSIAKSLIEIREECNRLGTICACVAMVSSISSGVCGL